MPEQFERVVTLVTPEEHMLFKLACTRDKVSMAALLRKLLLDWLEEHKSKGEDNANGR